ncbi:hypothetical protein V8G54_030379 [Vigna mungo]|uniref:Uncharacterized protein n=1 Tax=Vigna mungo TaxID=3915 RepID=A0AAQ3MWB3_VIGMU
MEKGTTSNEGEAQYFCKDFHWEDLRAEVEANPSYSYHFESASSSSLSPPPESDVLAWKLFHLRHASGRFFKVPSLFLFAFFAFNFPYLTASCHSGKTLFVEGVPRINILSPKL